VPDDPPTLASLRPPPDSVEDPVHRRTITMEVYQRGDYFAVVGDVWRDWSSAMAQDFVSGAYLVCALSPETVAATDEYITRAEPPAALRRLLIEGRDDVLRALRCQARDREA